MSSTKSAAPIALRAIRGKGLKNIDDQCGTENEGATSLVTMHDTNLFNWSLNTPVVCNWIRLNERKKKNADITW